jgi:hypothetical protein
VRSKGSVTSCHALLLVTTLPFATQRKRATQICATRPKTYPCVPIFVLCAFTGARAHARTHFHLAMTIAAPTHPPLPPLGVGCCHCLCYSHKCLYRDFSRTLSSPYEALAFVLGGTVTTIKPLVKPSLPHSLLLGYDGRPTPKMVRRPIKTSTGQTISNKVPPFFPI